MQVDVNGTRLWFDVDGPALVPDGSEMRQRPTVVLVHGGPGVYDHSYFKPDFARLAEHAQVVYLDLRGHGRSDWGDAAAWSFEACADDVRAFCDTVGIARPIVFGHSMGGPIVLLYGARHPRACGRARRPVGIRAMGRAADGRGLPPRRGRRGRRDRGAQLRRRATCPTRSGLVSPLPSAHTSRTKSERLARPRISSSTRAGWSSSADSTSSTSSAASTLPTLVSVGELDPVTPVAAAEEIVDAPARRHRAARGHRRSRPLHVAGRSRPLLADDHRVPPPHDRTRRHRLHSDRAVAIGDDLNSPPRELRAGC